MELERNRELKNWNTIFYLANILQHEDFDSIMKYCDGSLIITRQCFAKTKYGIAWKAYTCCCSLGNIVIEIDRTMHQISAAIERPATSCLTVVVWWILHTVYFSKFLTWATSPTPKLQLRQSFVQTTQGLLCIYGSTRNTRKTTTAIPGTSSQLKWAVCPVYVFTWLDSSMNK